MVSNYMPDVQVEIAWDSNYVTPAASRTWTDVSTYAELHDLITVAVGRQDERSTADANDLTLTLDNSDGRFTALRSGSPYYPDVKIGRPIRVKVTPPGGSTVPRFVGFIDEWPVEWDGTDAYAKATIRATSRMSRLGLTAKLKSMAEQEILNAGPVGYWTLGDPSGSTAASESSGNLGLQLAATGTGTGVVFGDATGPAVDGLTAATFANGQYLQCGPTLTTAGTPLTMRATVRLDALPSGMDDAGVVTINGQAIIVVRSDGVVRGAYTTGPSINDGATHDVALVYDGTDEILYLDGVEVDRGASPGGDPVPTGTVTVGSWPPADTQLTGVVAHVAVYNLALTAAQIAAQKVAVFAGFAGDRTDTRLLRILGWAGVAATEVDAETGVETMTYQQTTGQSVVDALHDVESTEGGVLFDGADGNVKFHNRSHRYLQTAVATLNMAAQHVESDYTPKLDRSTLVNDVTVDNPTTGATARQVDTASSDEYGIATGSATSVADSYTPLGEKAGWLIASYAEPRMRCPSLTVDVLAHQGLTPSAQTLLGVTVGSLLALTNAPTQSDTTSPTYFVEGYTETIGPESYFITFNLSPTYPTLNTFILDDADRGELDAGNVLAY